MTVPKFKKFRIEAYKPGKSKIGKVKNITKLSANESALGVSQLKKLDKFVKKRNQIAKIYSQNFNSDIFKKPEINKDNLHSFHLYPLLIKFNKLKITKSLFLKKLLAVGIRLQVHYIPTYLHPFYKKKFKFKKNDFWMFTLRTHIGHLLGQTRAPPV
jgi:dTDP-4-amino-4,6-dideoxygalactose transaminase